MTRVPWRPASAFAHVVFDAEKAFTDDVIDDFVGEYAAGRTPIPCVRCNSFTKFRDLVRRAEALGCDGIATGHYARIGDRRASRRSSAAPKTTGRTRRTSCGASTARPWTACTCRSETSASPGSGPSRASSGSRTAEKPESFEICFVPDNDYRGVLRRYLGPGHPALSRGDVVHRDGRVVGSHEGYAGFTVGQRRGLPGGFPEPMYVAEIRPEARQVVIGPREALQTSVLRAERANWLAEPPLPGEEIGVRIRHGAPVVEAVLTAMDGDRFELELLAPRRAVTPGQSAVLYREDVVVGGGVIVR